MRICGCGGVAASLAAPVAPEILPLLKQRLPIAEPRSFSDSSSHLLLILPFISSLSIANLAIAVAVAFCKNLAALASTRPARKIYGKRQTEQPSEPKSLQRQLSKESLQFQRQQQYIIKRLKNCFPLKYAQSGSMQLTRVFLYILQYNIFQTRYGTGTVQYGSVRYGTVVKYLDTVRYGTVPYRSRHAPIHCLLYGTVPYHTLIIGAEYIS